VKRALLLALALGACTKDSATASGASGTAAGPWMTKAQKGQELYATLKTTMGDVELKLYSKDAPKTVQNFVGLATGEKEWTDPQTHAKKKGVPLYDGTLFHRVIPNFMIQGGDPMGTGVGDPGYRFEDEFASGKTFDRVGLLAMANAGPNTNGSQFFITTSTPTYLNHKHTIFGEVVKGYDVVEAISRVPTGGANRPLEEVRITKVVVSDAP
jgi:peptidyl-prolyl cis-trans isomerase A (cyclophilin A)